MHIRPKLTPCMKRLVHVMSGASAYTTMRRADRGQATAAALYLELKLDSCKYVYYKLVWLIINRLLYVYPYRIGTLYIR